MQMHPRPGRVETRGSLQVEFPMCGQEQGGYYKEATRYLPGIEPGTRGRASRKITRAHLETRHESGETNSLQPKKPS